MIIKGPGGLGGWLTGVDYPNDSIAEDGQNTETNPGNLRRLAVTQTPVKNHQLTSSSSSSSSSCRDGSMDIPFLMSSSLLLHQLTLM